MEDIEKIVDDHSQQLIRHDEQIKTLFNRQDRLDEMVNGINKINLNVELLTAKQEATKERIEKVARDVDEMKEKPGKRWDGAMTSIISAAIGAILAFIFAAIGLK